MAAQGRALVTPTIVPRAILLLVCSCHCVLLPQSAPGVSPDAPAFYFQRLVSSTIQILPLCLFSASRFLHALLKSRLCAQRAAYTL
eukprot:3824021-Pleurochrysis_carterae.AAC.1